MDTEVQTTSPSDEIIENAKKSEEAGRVNFMNPEIKEGPKKRGRKPGSSNKPKDPAFSADKKESPRDAGGDTSAKSSPAFDIPTKTLCYLPARALSAWGVSYTHEPKAAMTADELEAFATGLGMVIDKHLPDVMKNYGPEMMFAMALTQYGVRIMAIKKLKEKAMKNVNQTPPTPQGTVNKEQKEPSHVHLVDQQEGADIPL